jgi:hypothetical protein
MNVMTDSKIKISNDLLNDDIQSSYNICTRLTNDDSLMETSEQMTTNNTDKMSRREKKMQERWSISTNNEQSPTKTLLGVEFPPIAVLRRKFSSSNKTNKNDTNPTTPAEVSNLIKDIREITTGVSILQKNILIELRDRSSRLCN